MLSGAVAGIGPRLIVGSVAVAIVVAAAVVADHAPDGGGRSGR